MSPPRLNAYRVAAGLLAFFALTHTAGGLFGPHAFGADAEAVFASMKSVEFLARGATCTWYGFWMGFGLNVTVLLLLSAGVAWVLGGIAPEERRRVAAIGRVLFAAQVAIAVLSWRYFFAPPGITATLVSILTGLECLRDLRASSGGATLRRA